MEHPPVTTLDPIKESLTHLLAITFAKTKSPLYPLAVAVAQGAKIYQEFQIEKQVIHVTIFDRKPEDAGRAQALLQYIRNWQGTQVFAQGRLISDPYQAFNVLNCYLKALSANDRTAHCHVVILDPTSSGPSEHDVFSGNINLGEILESARRNATKDKYIFPCRFIVAGFSYTKQHPSSIYDQIHARAVSFGCHFCPYFNEKDFRSV